jgi:hypothetical protein
MPLHKIVKDILDANSTSEEKRRELNEIKAAIELAEKMFSGELTYCKKCGDYYLSRSFFTDTEDVDERVCVYSDPINSGGDEYETKKVRYTYKICPKGCKHQISRVENPWS